MELLLAEATEVKFAAGRFTAGDGERGIGLLALAVAARDPANLPEGIEPGLDAEAYNSCDVFTFPSGCHVAEVEIDPETGAVTLDRYAAIDDYGRVINPMLTIGQLQGGLAQGIGQALVEHTVYDDASGQLLSGSLMDYALPRAGDLPGLEVSLAELPATANPLGVKGAGQAGCIAAPQTIVNAILDALAPVGVEHIDMRRRRSESGGRSVARRLAARRRPRRVSCRPPRLTARIGSAILGIGNGARLNR